ncbi:hypothetical protein F5J12DRAFT_802837 [Pisolithus orientalis]|uniref:uncharacterized protein n=1 Tax=Pisolithus orientalis TaxID=936130 RepID=UPI0022255E8B|nr:uncharacterized protein F5J12DRAFT_802837 [Pisolithus orientalis]KAI6030788.1 hypothetical protein F5J12DRAFT_802837 [Pisolithus orientalis]
MPFRLPFSQGSSARRERTPRSGGSWWRRSRSSAAGTPADDHESVPPSSGQSLPRIHAPVTTSSPSSSYSTPHSHADSLQELTSNATSSQPACNGDDGSTGGAPRGGGQHHYHGRIHSIDEDDTLESDGFPNPFNVPGPLSSAPGNRSLSGPLTQQPDLSSQASTPQDWFLSGQTQQSPQPRTWQNRAFDAFRNLTRARQSGIASASAVTGETLASQTLLIYVIGGFSSDDHHVIMGGNLDSFEALWELAEFLGQVKPPTASREDIERSGLEVIQSSSLEEYEKTGRIANNCIERCLICLEDYTPEEHIRVLTCKHAFHQACVDRWLETGRNNCPACRSKGVENTSSGSSTTADTSTSTSRSTS